MAKYISDRMKKIVSKVVEGKEKIESHEIVAVDQNGQNALMSFLRRVRNDIPPKAVYNTMLKFLNHGFDLYQPNDDGMCALTLLFSKISRDASRIDFDNEYYRYITHLIQVHHYPRKPPRNLLHPLVVLSRIFADHPTDNPDLSLVRYGIVRFVFKYTSSVLDDEEITEMIVDGIQRQNYDFIDPIIRYYFGTFDKRMQSVIAHAFMRERMSHDIEMSDEMDNSLLKHIIKSFHDIDFDLLLEAAVKEDDAFLKLVIPRLSKETRARLLREYLSSESCDAETKIINIFLKCGVRINDADLLDTLVRDECGHIIKRLYGGHAVSKKLLDESIRRCGPTNPTGQQLQKFLTRSRLMTRLAQASPQTMERHRVKTKTRHTHSNPVLTQVLGVNNPDILKSLSEFII
jgi:hypothetical protein